MTAIKEITVEYRQHPLGIDAKHPRFAWKLAAVLWGYRPDALYHCRMVYGAQKVRIGALTTSNRLCASSSPKSRQRRESISCTRRRG